MLSKDVGHRVLILGGTGRVGQSICRELQRRSRHESVNLDICIAGRNENVGEEIVRESPSLQFKKVDYRDKDALVAAMKEVDLVVHSAGPFQQRQSAEVLEAAISAGVNYQDVCDDVDHMEMSRGLHNDAVESNITAAVCTGIYPGISNMMAAKAIRDLDVDPEQVTFDYFTAGTGGAGPTILSTTFLLCGEDVRIYVDGKPTIRKPASGVRTVDFGEQVGHKNVFLLNLPEVLSIAEVYKVPNISARFGTAPGIWNVLTRFMAYAVPKNILTNQALIAKFSEFIGPLVRAVDAIVGGTTAMRVEAVGTDGSSRSLLYGHEELSECVGIAAAAFTWHLLTNKNLPKGVLYPEELLSDPEEFEAVLESGVRTAFDWKTFTDNSL
ncbi:hypothetical protein NDN08_001142 [Rhodosorus marinus]|uniref:Saccharopine dehydrogenase NADP binding domain-containing protein n=1 Tax=Rhodosorus marinus TaxID=101924 RepID=A0AAV8UPX8_9RHOD|nr:hypothetical protein NDN08_001142 [Rhodosorus marinus]